MTKLKEYSYIDIYYGLSCLPHGPWMLAFEQETGLPANGIIKGFDPHNNIYLLHGIQYSKEEHEAELRRIQFNNSINEALK